MEIRPTGGPPGQFDPDQAVDRAIASGRLCARAFSTTLDTARHRARTERGRGPRPDRPRLRRAVNTADHQLIDPGDTYAIRSSPKADASILKTVRLDSFQNCWDTEFGVARGDALLNDHSILFLGVPGRIRDRGRWPTRVRSGGPVRAEFDVRAVRGDETATEAGADERCDEISANAMDADSARVRLR